MSFKHEYPDYAVIEAHIRRARIERSVVVSQMIVAAITGVGRGLKWLVARVATARRPMKANLAAR